MADFETWTPIPDSHPAKDFAKFTDYVKDNKTGLLWAKGSLQAISRAATRYAWALDAAQAKLHRAHET